ncbi:dolichol kinase [Elasticomyces elasticus]|uniref:dolichol kinase n=1 Tax=Exophiala sideris TaxID=1016849 RepID=A0ABR0JA86_9EURO|nr:dolichol kinase [Elasticomyces elasticus]KAK5020993.1 dolichol kinase [Exophiala sideris]KAK5023302.1 dolichol kinase [Exophiala sideris]KAK5059345.1 dolichol kinase [Exophiala sideris]KAK5176152.1 dolichol kinase [Eurotiomycetes sp. CCFEE 6388]
MTPLGPARSDNATSSSHGSHTRQTSSLDRTPQPYHIRGDSLIKATGLFTFTASDTRNGHITSSFGRSESSESGTEADDEKGPLLKGLPAPPLRLRKGLRGSSPAGLTPAASPLPTPPAFVEAREFEYFGANQKTTKRTQQAGKQTKDFEAYKRRKRREIVRRCAETSLLCVIAAIVGSSECHSAELWNWSNELIAFLILPPLAYALYPLRIARRARVAGKTSLQALRSGFHIPSRFDPGPLLYPVALPVMIALSLFDRSAAFLPAAIVCGLSSIPPLVTTTSRIPALGDHIHWLVSVLPLHTSNWQLLHGDIPISLPLKLGPASPLSQESLILFYPLHLAMVSVLGYLTTSSLDISELQLLSTALINLYVFAASPQAEILKAMLWLGGLCVLISCRHFLIWEVALARVPTWKLLRRRAPRDFISQIDQSICALLTRGRLHRKRGVSSDSEDELPVKQFPRIRKLQVNGRASTMPTTEALSSMEVPLLRSPSFDTPGSSRPSRRNTFTVFGPQGRKELPTDVRKAQSNTAGRPNAFMSFTLEQARARKYVYAALAYVLVMLTILGPIRLYVDKRALSGHEPFGWALGYLLGNIPKFRFWVVSNNLDKWICLPPRSKVDAVFDRHISVEDIRQHILGPANTRLLICIYCVAVLLVGIVAVFRLTSVVEVDTRRKVFHGIMVAMLLPSIFVDPCFIALALSLVLAIFLLLDLFRASQLPPISKPLTTFLAPYVDGRDHRGPVIVSHIFLLIGCAIPLWLSLAAAPRSGEGPWAGWDTTVRDLNMVSGVICVGMGDAAASLIGRRYGKTKWCWAGGKSLEGSLAFAIAVVCGLSATWVWLRIGGWAPWNGQSIGLVMGKCIVAGLGASLLESTLTAANDNVVVPVGLWLLVRGLHI